MWRRFVVPRTPSYRSLFRYRNWRQKKYYFYNVFKTLFGLFFLNICYYKTDVYMPTEPTYTTRNTSKYITYFEHDRHTWRNSTSKKILVWTPFFKQWDTWLDEIRDAMTRCPATCSVTASRRELEASDAIYFHASDLWHYTGLFAHVYQRHIEMPDKRRPGQVWVLFSLEPIVKYWGHIPYTFNWTVYHRRESTISSTFSSSFAVSEEELHSKTDYFSKKKKFASTLISNCRDQALRYRMIHELKKHIDIDVFGHCTGQKVCKKSSCVNDCENKLLSRYKFYIAFENSHCRDYTSEKFWNAIARRQIPVIAASNYTTELLPPRSYINVFDFPSLKDVADHMRRVGRNRALYNSYFDWIAGYRPEASSPHCRLCMALHSNRTPQSYDDMDAWLDDDVCYRNTVCLLY